jgi:hypothetical protein
VARTRSGNTTRPVTHLIFERQHPATFIGDDCVSIRIRNADVTSCLRSSLTPAVRLDPATGGWTARK